MNNQPLKENTGTKLHFEKTVNQEKGKIQGSEEQLCPLVRNPRKSCYCYNLNTHVNIRKAIYYCTTYFRDCEIYVSIKKDKGVGIEKS